WDTFRSARSVPRSRRTRSPASLALDRIPARRRTRALPQAGARRAHSREPPVRIHRRESAGRRRASSSPAMSAPAAERRIFIGTSGFSFRDWVGPFYPPGTASGDFLEYYSRHFGVVEVNSTYYGIPKPRMMELLVKKTPDHFRFVTKLH